MKDLIRTAELNNNGYLTNLGPDPNRISYLKRSQKATSLQ